MCITGRAILDGKGLVSSWTISGRESSFLDERVGTLALRKEVGLDLTALTKTRIFD